jgi:hypothetical protein
MDVNGYKTIKHEEGDNEDTRVNHDISDALLVKTATHEILLMLAT